jgi:hypothetical protein
LMRVVPLGYIPLSGWLITMHGNQRVGFNVAMRGRTGAGCLNIARESGWWRGVSDAR